ncbi:MAG: hypothetical protein K1X48_00425 [Burkholderiaceae bacterium]|nr:hypothetical protein [Burkholderiaceae bacterium]
MSRYLLWLLIGSIFLSACSSLTPLPQPKQLGAFERTGRISIKTEDIEGRAQQFTIGFFVQSGQADELMLRLTDPFGNVQAEVLSRAENTLLRLPNQALQSYSSFNELSKSLIGVEIPITAWRYWIIGQLDPHFPGLQHKNHQQQTELTQFGFVIFIEATHPNGTPQLMNISRKDQPQLLIRLAIEES